jgi:hypothetical protein
MKTKWQDILTTIVGIGQLVIAIVWQSIEASNGGKINYGLMALSIGVAILGYFTAKSPVLANDVSTVITNTEKTATEIMPVLETLMKDYPGRWANIVHLALDYYINPDVQTTINTLKKPAPVTPPVVIAENKVV